MSDLFNPFVDRTIKDGGLSHTYSGQVVDQAPFKASVANSYMTSALPRNRLLWLLIGFSIGALILMLRLLYLQAWMGNDYRARAEENRVQVTNIPAPRGIIYDRHGVALVQNEPNFVATIVPSELPSHKRQPEAFDMDIEAIAVPLGLDVNTLEQQVIDHAEKYYAQPLVVREFIDHEEAIALITELTDVVGVHIEAQPSRNYLMPNAFAHVLGYLGRISPDQLETLSNDYALSDPIGKSGLEDSFEQVLRGQKGEQVREVTATGTTLNMIAEQTAVPGSNLVLGIDAQLQQKLYDALKEEVDKRRLPGGSAVALDPNTGIIRALVSYPSYDTNLFIKGISTEDYSALADDERRPLFNKAISGEYPSGSTFKLVMAAAALQEGVVTPQTTVNSTGGIQVDSLFPDWKAGGHGITNVYKALAESVNTYFYLAGGGTYNAETREITGGLGIDRIDDYAEKFGLGEVSGLDIAGEADGFVPTRAWKEQVKGEPWYLGDTYHVSIGQGDLLVTPLQVAMYTSVVANGGTLYRPQLVERVTNQAGETISTTQPIVRREGFVSPQNLKVVRDGMRDAVTYGSARSLSSLPFTSAAKTGTAQIGGTEATHSWFTVFAPYEDPKLVLTVLVEKGGEGTEAAVPIARQVLTDYQF